ncbi:MAG: ribonucleotide reductase subunit alpha [Ramlibacter sp.]|nr:ribonucleotide reductase subunit alpha [Ramlibacter sp.]
MTGPSHFERLLQAAASQAEPQRLLFLFAGAELPADATAAQRERFHAGQGGALAPLACVDKSPGDLSSFAALVDESRQACPPWQVVFIAALSGQAGRPPSPSQVDGALHAMVDNLRAGRVGDYLAFGPDGEALSFS